MKRIGKVLIAHATSHPALYAIYYNTNQREQSAHTTVILILLMEETVFSPFSIHSIHRAFGLSEGERSIDPARTIIPRSFQFDERKVPNPCRIKRGGKRILMLKLRTVN